MGKSVNSNDERILAEAKRNLKVAKEQMEKYKNNDKIPEETKKLFQQNYKNAQVNLKNLIEMDKKMAEASLTDVHKTSSALENLNKIAKRKPKNSGMALPERLTDNNVAIHFPSSAEIRSAVNYSHARSSANAAVNNNQKSAEPATTKKMSTREAFREAARQSFMGGSAKKKTKQTTKKASGTDHSMGSEAGMTREEYRKRHGK